MNAGIYRNNFTKHSDQQRRVCADGADNRTMRRKHIISKKLRNMFYLKIYRNAERKKCLGVL